MKRAPWIVVVVLALALWLVPIAVVYVQQAPPPRVAKRPLMNDGVTTATGPLILYADTWPTRETINLEEVQASTQETDHILGPKAIANDVTLALEDLGIVGEPQRIDDLPDDVDLLGERPIILVYPVRHNQPPAAIVRFIDQRLEPAVAAQPERRAMLQLYDVVIAEKAPQAERAQASMRNMLTYYSLSYNPGAVLLEPMKSIELYEHVQAFAKTVTVPHVPKVAP